MEYFITVDYVKIYLHLFVTLFFIFFQQIFLGVKHCFLIILVQQL